MSTACDWISVPVYTDHHHMFLAISLHLPPLNSLSAQVDATACGNSDIDSDATRKYLRLLNILARVSERELTDLRRFVWLCSAYKLILMQVSFACRLIEGIYSISRVDEDMKV